MSSLLKNAASNRAMGLRSQGEELAEWFKFLPPEERELMRLRFVDGLEFTRIAPRMGLKANAVRKRVLGLLARINSRAFKLVALSPSLLPKRLRRIAKFRVLEGRSLREVERATPYSLHKVRTLDKELQVHLKYLA